MHDCADLFTVVLRNDDIQEFDTRWREILSSMEQLPPDGILESLNKLKIRESEKTQEIVRRVQDQRCQSGPSARNSFEPNEGRFSKDHGADQQRLQISDVHFHKFTNPATFACWKIRFKTEVCACSQFPTEATLWIQEVELVDSVDD